MAGRLAKNLKEDYLSCNICLNQFHKPKTLPCDHSFCEECIKLHAQQTLVKRHGCFQLACPLCRREISVDSRHGFDIGTWLRTLQTDPLLESLLSTVHAHESKPSGFTYLPSLCELHGGKPRDAYCFTHAQLVCWECAARNHKQCEVESSENAHDVVHATINSLKETVGVQLTKAKELGKTDKRFAESKSKTLDEIGALERKLDSVYTSTKQQLLVLRGDIEHCTKLHLDEHKSFYSAVSQLLELNQALEILDGENQNTTATLTALESIKHEVSEATISLDHAGSMKDNGDHFVKFVPDEHVSNFISSYSSIGFIDSNVPGSGMEHDAPTPRDTPASISHILKRNGPKPSVTSGTKPSAANTQKPKPPLSTSKQPQATQTAAKTSQLQTTARRPRPIPNKPK